MTPKAKRKTWIKPDDLLWIKRRENLPIPHTNAPGILHDEGNCSDCRKDAQKPQLKHINGRWRREIKQFNVDAKKCPRKHINLLAHLICLQEPQ